MRPIFFVLALFGSLTFASAERQCGMLLRLTETFAAPQTPDQYFLNHVTGLQNWATERINYLNGGAIEAQFEFENPGSRNDTFEHTAAMRRQTTTNHSDLTAAILSTENGENHLVLQRGSLWAQYNRLTAMHRIVREFRPVSEDHAFYRMSTAEFKVLAESLAEEFRHDPELQREILESRTEISRMSPSTNRRSHIVSAIAGALGAIGGVVLTSFANEGQPHTKSGISPAAAACLLVVTPILTGISWGVTRLISRPLFGKVSEPDRFKTLGAGHDLIDQMYLSTQTPGVAGYYGTYNGQRYVDIFFHDGMVEILVWKP